MDGPTIYFWVGNQTFDVPYFLGFKGGIPNVGIFRLSVRVLLFKSSYDFIVGGPLLNELNHLLVLVFVHFLLSPAGFNLGGKG